MTSVSRSAYHPPICNRLRAVMLHVPWYTIQGQHRLAADCYVSSSTISRLVRNQTSPSYRLARAVTDALARRLGVPLDMRDIFSTDGSYPTACVCDLSPSCTGCFPPEALDDDGQFTPAFVGLKPGDWCTYPALQTPPAQASKPLSITTHL